MCGCLATFFLSTAMFRVYMRNVSTRFQSYESRLEKREQLLKEKKAEIQEKTTAIRKLMDELNHQGSQPASSTILGCVNSYRIDRKELEDIRLNALVKPNNHLWNKVAMGPLTRMDEWVERIEQVALKLREHVSKTNRKYEKLQE